MEREPVDLLVIGGGITGAGIAWDAALRGLKVALLEERDFAFGTSSRSTKLIHGGLRYLAQGEINLVREVGRERAILYRLCPHIVYPLQLLLPIYNGGQYSRWSTSIGLWIYDRLAGVLPEERRVMLSAGQTAKREPLLTQEGLRGGGMYVEYRTDDARLTVEVMKSAHRAGALIANYAKVSSLIYDDANRVCGALVQDLALNRVFTVRAKRVVNAAGPWVDTVRALDGKVEGKRLHLTKGVHVTVQREKLPVQHALYLGTEDGRMIFVIPRDEVTYIGTTDTDYADDIAKPVCTREDAEYLLAAVNAHFPEAKLGIDDFLSSWAGLRPLIHEDGKSPSELSRKEEIFQSASGFYSMAGGKLTGFRKMAEKIVDMVVADLRRESSKLRVKPCSTDKSLISGGEIGPGGYEAFHRRMSEFGKNEYGFTAEIMDRLLHRYGANVRVMFEAIDRSPRQAERIGGQLPLIRAELEYAVAQEMVVTLTDFLLRRTGDLLFATEAALEAAPQVLMEMAGMLGWDQAEQARQWQMWQDAVEEATGFKR